MSEVEAPPDEAATGGRRFAVILTGLVMALVAVGALVRGLDAWVAESDFRNFYTGAAMVAGGAGPELGDVDAQVTWQHRFWPQLRGPKDLLAFFSPPWFGLVLAPLALLPPTQAYLLWLVAEWGLLAALLIQLRSLLPGAAALRAHRFLLAFPPVLMAAMQGQPSYLLALAFLAAWRELDRGRDLRAGAWLSLLALKPQLLLVPTLWLVWERRGRALAGLLASGLLLLGLSLLVSGPRGLLAWAELLLEVGSTGGPPPLQRHAMQCWLGLLAQAGVDGPALKLGWAAASVLALGALLFASRGPLRPRLELTWALVVVVSAFSSAHLHIHDLTILVVPAALVVRARPAVGPFLVGAVALSWIGLLGGARLPPVMVAVELAAIAWLVRDLRRPEPEAVRP